MDCQTMTGLSHPSKEYSLRAAVEQGDETFNNTGKLLWSIYILAKVDLALSKSKPVFWNRKHEWSDVKAPEDVFSNNTIQNKWEQLETPPSNS